MLAELQRVAERLELAHRFLRHRLRNNQRSRPFAVHARGVHRLLGCCGEIEQADDELRGDGRDARSAGEAEGGDGLVVF